MGVESDRLIAQYGARWTLSQLSPTPGHAVGLALIIWYRRDGHSFGQRRTRGYPFTRTVGCNYLRAQNPAKLLAGLCARPGAGSSVLRDLVSRRRARPGGETRFQPWYTAGVFHSSVRAPSLQCHAYLDEFLTAFLVVWAIRKRPVWELGAWGLHVLVDVPTHSSSFFPTPVFWPLFSWKFDGWQWMNLAILVPNYVLLSLCYAWFISQSVRAGNSRGPETPR
jgi:hypothetical protein